MPDVQEVFRMTTQKIRPDQGFVDRQLARQRARTRNRKLGAVALAAVIGLIGTVVVIRAMDGDAGTRPASEPTDGIVNPGADPLPSLPGAGSVETGRYVFSSSDPALDATHEISIDVPDGYGSVGESAVLKEGTGQTSLSTIVISDVYADPCRWQGGEVLDDDHRTVTELVFALTDQQGLRVSAPTDATVGGFPATYLERRVPSATNVSDCDLGQFHLYSTPGWGDRWLDAGGQLQRLWVVDVDGAWPLVIDVTVQPDTTRRVQAELEQMVGSIQIEPVEEA